MLVGYSTMLFTMDSWSTKSWSQAWMGTVLRMDKVASGGELTPEEGLEGNYMVLEDTCVRPAHQIKLLHYRNNTFVSSKHVSKAHQLGINMLAHSIRSHGRDGMIWSLPALPFRFTRLIS